MLNRSWNILFMGALLAGFCQFAEAQYWQQRVEYSMEIDVDAEKHQYTGKQTLVYHNNSADELERVFYHLYFNAFQPGSMMDVRSQTIQDPDRRVKDRIGSLKEDEIGYIKVKSLKMNGKDVKYEEVETILEVTLDDPIKAGASATFEMEYEAQVPLQVRRSGRDNAEGIEFSMSQWYPKMCEYDYQGWHSNPYVGREFHGVWGDFDVKITMDKKYTIAGTGYLQNNNEIGHGYEDVGVKVDISDKEKLTWHFKAPNVHDFVWAADPDYVHDIVDVNDTFQLHFFYQDEEDLKANWGKLQPYAIRAFKFIGTRFGQYPYRQYSVIQGGDGGMEYPMATLITGKRNLGSLVGVTVHEAMHTWFQMLMGTNEALYAWMDEGFTTYSTNEVMAVLGLRNKENPHMQTYAGYAQLALSSAEEPLTTHADHFHSNFGYGSAAYDKGCVFLRQMEYVIGEGNVAGGMMDYYDQWRFKHPNPNDFIRIMEKRSGLELDWYKEYWMNTIHTIDYEIKEVLNDKKETKVILHRKEWVDSKTGKLHGGMPMPIDLVVEYLDGKDVKEQTFYIPLRIMRGEKPDEGYHGRRTVLEDWPWTNTTYEVKLPFKLSKIQKITIDPSARMADVDIENNVYKGK